MIATETPLSEIKGIAPRFLKNFGKLGIFTVKDLLWHFPARYEDFSEIVPIASLEPGQHATVQGVIERIKIRRSFRRHFVIVEAVISDESGSINAAWFNQPYLLNVLRQGRHANFSGKVTAGDEEFRLSHPAYELIHTQTGADMAQTDAKNFPRSSASSQQLSAFLHTGRIVPIYPETRGLTSRGIRFFLEPILRHAERIPEWLPREALKSARLPDVNRALRDIHFPATLDDAERAGKRFSFEELFLLQVFNLRRRQAAAGEPAQPLVADIEKLKTIIANFPFTLTPSQKKSLWEIIQDLEKSRPMNRLLQGDVGSGKTVIAALAALIAADKGAQAAFMAPTEILARQHFLTLKKLFARIAQKNQPAMALLTSNESKILYENDLETAVRKTPLLKEIKEGKIKIIVGTHALIQKKVGFKNLGLAVVDEQHRFGVAQRKALTRNPNVTNTSELPEQKTKIIEKELSYQLNGIFFKIQHELGRYARERQYADAFEQKLTDATLQFRRERPIETAGRKSNFADFIVADKILVELKAKPFIKKEDYYQTIRYLKAANLELGLIVNFRQEYLKPKRILNPDYSGHSDAFGSLDRVLIPHLLSMSATPIPRTLMLTIFGDLDISTITEMPVGRKPILTKIVAPANRPKAYQFIREQIKKGRQAFVICPRIGGDAPLINADERQIYADTKSASISKNQHLSALFLESKTVKEEYEKLSKTVFPDLRVAMLHGKMSSSAALREGRKSKEEVMKEFAAGNIDILVSTSVVEVGVDIPNATIMMIEGAERFGLAQLYQFRGRVGRAGHQSFCFLFTESNAKTAHDRLNAILEAKNGFELAERDLRIRGPGEFIGQKQTGLPDIAMSGIQDIELVKLSRAAALKIFETDSSLNRYPLLKEKLAEFAKKIHLE